MAYFAIFRFELDSGRPGINKQDVEVAKESGIGKGYMLNQWLFSATSAVLRVLCVLLLCFG